MLRRVIASSSVLAGGLLTFGALAGTASAATAPTTSTAPTYSTAAGWVYTLGSGNNAINANVALSVTQEPEQPATLYEMVSQQSCDHATNVGTIQSYSNTDAPAENFSFSPGYNGAILNADVPLDWTTTTFTGCASGPTGTPTTVDHGQVPTSISASWIADGPFKASGPNVETRSAKSIGQIEPGEDGGPSGNFLPVVDSSISRTS